MIGIIGFGRFGKLMTKYLAQDFEVFVYDINCKSAEVRQAGAVPVALETACRQGVVVLPVPISDFKDVLRKISPHLKENALVVDVCSVKVLPARWMQEILPPQIAILATHPTFGPDSASDSLKGRKIALCKVRMDQERFEIIKTFLSSKGLVVIETTPEEHDRQIAVSLALTHFIGRSLSAFGAVEQYMDTEGYKRLLHILEVVEHDTWQLFSDMHRYNPYAREKRVAFMAAMQNIERRLTEEP
jgi:prephenate dehydrogenase